MKELKNEELVKDYNQSHSNESNEINNKLNLETMSTELKNDIKKIDKFLSERLSDWMWDELKYFRKESNECNETQIELICSGKYYEISPLIKYFNDYVNK